MMWDDGAGWWWISSWFIILLFGLGFAGIIYLIVHIVGNKGKSESSAGKNNALEIAKERYAKGEISKEEFEQIKKDVA